ncbi:MAG: hypothetical protein RR505_14850, partial [Raoultibacter sp.]
NDDSHGYSQVNRWGPDCDCSSLMYMAARASSYDVQTSGTRYTGTMLDHFQRAGWVAVPFDGNLYDCAPGCIALNVKNHVEAFVDWGRLGGAHVDEHGGVRGCCQGDQTGNEISVGPAYTPSYGWDYILIPPDDDSEPSAPQPVTGVKPPMYRLKTATHGWLDWMLGLECADGCGDTFAGVPGHAAIGFEVDWKGGGGWFILRTKDHPQGLDRNVSGDGSSIVGITLYYETQEPDSTGYYKAKYRVAPVGGDYYKWEFDDEDGYAGDGETAIDRLQLTLAKS